ncbi:MAG TPA: response regulator [Rhizomicrobium sp.]|nr:response regulator [Rhizomicrobium sp.]
MAKILAVEDEHLVRSLIVETLEGEGHNVLDAPDGEEALFIVQGQPDIDLIVTDIRMPKVDGFTLALSVRAAQPGIALLFMTGYTGANPPRELASEKMLHKPFAPDELVLAVEALLARRSR